MYMYTCSFVDCGSALTFPTVVSFAQRDIARVANSGRCEPCPETVLPPLPPPLLLRAGFPCWTFEEKFLMMQDGEDNSPGEVMEDSTLCLCTGLGIAGPKRTIRFYRDPPPSASSSHFVIFLRPFKIARNTHPYWLVSRKQACALFWIGLLVTIAGMISIQVKRSV